MTDQPQPVGPKPDTRTERQPPGADHQEIIPGAYEADTATSRDPGAVGGRFNGADQQSAPEGTVADDSVRDEWRKIGGGTRK